MHFRPFRRTALIFVTLVCAGASAHAQGGYYAFYQPPATSMYRPYVYRPYGSDEDSSGGNGQQDASPSTSSGAHHSMGELFSSASSLRRDLSEPTFHTMSHLAIEARSLQPDPTDPNHHTIGEATNPSP